MKYYIHFKKDLEMIVKEEYLDIIDGLWQNDKFLNKIKKITNNDVVFSVGGDGTFLTAVNNFGCNKLYIPINAGTLGFYTSWNKDNIRNIINEEINIINANMLKIKYGDEEFYSVNETTIINPINTQIFDIYINDNLLEHFRGTGICISTPTGSTAYNKSLGGAIIDPNKELFQLVKIAPINNTKYRTLSNPIILSYGDRIRLKSNLENFNHSIITIDRENYSLKNVEEVEVTLSKRYVEILSSDINIWEKIKDKFI